MVRQSSVLDSCSAGIGVSHCWKIGLLNTFVLTFFAKT